MLGLRALLLLAACSSIAQGLQFRNIAAARLSGNLSDLSSPEDQRPGQVQSIHEQQQGSSRRVLAAEDSQVSRLEQEFNARKKQDEMTRGMKILPDEAELISAQPEDIYPDIRWWTVLWMTGLMGAAAALGSLPFFFVGSLSKEWAALANALACGVMLACSFDLVHEGQPYGAGHVILGIILGAIFISASQKWLEEFEDVRFQGLQGINARKILLMIGIMAAHALGEGAGVGVSFCGNRGWAQGVLVTLAIGLHNVPEGLAVSTVLVARGIAPRRALLWTLFTAMPQPLVAVPSFLFVDTFRTLLPVALGFAAGCMLWMVFAELLPDALEDASHGKVASTATFAAAWLEGLRMLLASFEAADGSFRLPPVFSWHTLAAAVCLIIPSALTGTAAGYFSKFLARTNSNCIALAAGIVIWQGSFQLYRLLHQGSRPSAGRLILAAAAGSIALYTFRKVQVRRSLARGGGKLKEGGTPKKSLDSVIVAAELGSNGGEAGDGSALPLYHQDLDLEGTEKKVYGSYRQPMGQLEVVNVGLTCVAVAGISRGLQIAHLDSVADSSVYTIWFPICIEALGPAVAAAVLLKAGGSHRASPQGQLWLATALASLPAVAVILESMHMDLAESSVETLAYILAASCGGTLTAGLPFSSTPYVASSHLRPVKSKGLQSYCQQPGKILGDAAFQGWQRAVF